MSEKVQMTCLWRWSPLETPLDCLTQSWNERMPKEWDVLVLKNKGYVLSCNNYREIRLIRHIMKIRERVVKDRLQGCLL